MFSSWKRTWKGKGQTREKKMKKSKNRFKFNIISSCKLLSALTQKKKKTNSINPCYDQLILVFPTSTTKKMQLRAIQTTTTMS